MSEVNMTATEALIKQAEAEQKEARRNKFIDASKVLKEDGSIDELKFRAEYTKLLKFVGPVNLVPFIEEMLSYRHDYGSIVVATGLAAAATAWSIQNSARGGLTGFQGNCIVWEFIQGWDSSLTGKCGARIQRFDNLLFPQYSQSFTTIPKDVWQNLQKEAKEQLETTVGDNFIAQKVRDHWQSIVDGNVPFNLKVSG